MTAALTAPSFKNISAGLVGLVLACVCFFAAAPQAQASGLTPSQVQAVIDLLVAFDVEESAISEVSTILHQGMTEEPSSAEVLGASTQSAVAPTCPPLPPGVEAVSGQNESGSCSVSLSPAQSLAVSAPMPPAPPPPPLSEVPDVAGLMATAAMAPWFAAVDSLTEILLAVGIY